jgi:hypothetical protein
MSKTVLLRMDTNSGDLCDKYMEERRSVEKLCLWISLITSWGRHVGPGEKLNVLGVESGGVSDPISAGCVCGSIVSC